MQLKTPLRLDDAPDILLLPEVARIMRCQYRSVLNMCHVPGFPAMRIGRKFVVNKEGLRRWLEAQAGGQ